MEHQRICGAIVFTIKDGQILYVIVKSLKSDYGFPKGHAEPNESDKEAAMREITEETCLKVNFIDGFKDEHEYSPIDNPDVVKHLVLFLAQYDYNQKFAPQKEELESIDLMNLRDAMRVIKHENLRRSLKKADEFIRSIKKV